MLKNYLKEHNIKQITMAKALGISKGLMSCYVNGIYQIPPLRAKQIEALTKGEITRQMLRPDIF